MKETVYKLTTLRLLEFWIAPILILALMAFFVYADFRNHAHIHSVRLVLYFALCLIFIVPFIWLYLDHLKKSTTTQLIFRETNMSFQKGNDIYTIPYTDITEVVEYSLNKYGNSKLMWSDIIKWQVKTETSEFAISSLLISKKHLKQFIKVDFGFKATYFPTL